MARVDVIMPQMGESIAEGTMSRWLKKVGDEVKRDEPIFEISTDKVDAEIPAPSAGRLAEIVVTEGQTVPVGSIVARLETDAGAALDSAAPTSVDIPGAPAPASPTPEAAPKSGADERTPDAPVAGEYSGSSAGAKPAEPGSLEDRLRTKSSPLVRKMAAEHGIELSSLQGSGIQGRVTKKDLLGVIESGGARQGGGAAAGAGGGERTAQQPHQASQSHGPLPEPWPGDVVEPMSVMRARISEHMVISRRTSAHVTSVHEVDLTRVARIRQAQRASFERETGEKLTFLPFILRGLVEGLKKYPILNSSVRGTDIIYRKQMNIGIAVALDWGLIVPVVKNADRLSLAGITHAVNDLAKRARAKKLNPDEVQQGTFTVSNYGSFGSLIGTPVINQPQVAIMGLGAIEKRPKVITGADGEDTIAIRTCCYLALSFDHRIIDGSIADQFMQMIKQTLETFPESGF